MTANMAEGVTLELIPLLVLVLLGELPGVAIQVVGGILHLCRLLGQLVHFLATLVK